MLIACVKLCSIYNADCAPVPVSYEGRGVEGLEKEERKGEVYVCWRG